MKAAIAALLALTALTVSAAGFAADAPWSYEGVKSLWEKNRDSMQYHGYSTEFMRYVSYYHIDQKGACYSLSPDPVELFLVVGKTDDDKFAQVEHVLSNLDNEKSRCFQKNYQGLRVKLPPFTPYVLQLEMK